MLSEERFDEIKHQAEALTYPPTRKAALELIQEIIRLRVVILYSLDCLEHDDIRGALNTLRGAGK